MPKHKQEGCGANLKFIRRCVFRLQCSFAPFEERWDDVPRVSDIKMLLETNERVLRETIKPGVASHCSRCLSVWNVMQKLLHDPNSLKFDIEEESKFDIKEKYELEQKQVLLARFSTQRDRVTGTYARTPEYTSSPPEFCSKVTTTSLSEAEAVVEKVKVPLVSDEELLAFISELKEKHPTHTSIKSLCKHLKREKPEWQVTETRITKLLKKR
jgi:hypothetical protein